jgi:hypothetical protein
MAKGLAVDVSTRTLTHTQAPIEKRAGTSKENTEKKEKVSNLLLAFC